VNRLARQVRFDYWANQESLCAIEKAKSDSSTFKIAGHIAGVSELWLARLESTACALKVWPELTAMEIDSIFREQLRRWLALCEIHSIETPVRYISSAGTECLNRFEEIIQEVALHGAHHRGQLALLLRIQGAHPPVSTDFIPALRDERF
jgi:uncharacterized damage-inducible protein DinB